MKSLQVEWIDGWTEREQRRGHLPLQLPVIVSFWRLPNELPNQKCLACSSGVAAGSATSAHCTVECRKEVQWVGTDFDLHAHKKVMCVNVSGGGGQVSVSFDVP